MDSSQKIQNAYRLRIEKIININKFFNEKVLNSNRKELIGFLIREKLPIIPRERILAIRIRLLQKIRDAVSAALEKAKKVRNINFDKLQIQLFNAPKALKAKVPEINLNENTIRLDPSMITKQYLQEKVGNRPNTKYSWYILDDNNRLQIVTPRENDYTPAKANSHFNGVLTTYYKPATLYMQIYSPNEGPQDFALFDGTINCVLATISAECPKLSAKINQYAIDNNFINNDRPATKEDVDNFHKKFRVRIVIHSQTDIWHISNPIDKNNIKTIHIYAHDNHASKYIPIQPIEKVVISENIDELSKNIHQPKKLTVKLQMNNSVVMKYQPQSDIQFTEEELEELHLLDDMDSPAGVNDKTPFENRGQNVVQPTIPQLQYTIEAFRTDSTIYKSYQPPQPDTDNKDYYHCTSELSYEYTKFINMNNIRPLNEPYYSIVKSADHHLTTQQFQDYSYNQIYHSYDQNKAFPSFSNSPYYPKYKIFYGFVQLYANTDLQYISKPGMSFITNVIYNNPVLDKIKWIQDNNWYTHIRLNFIIENNLATFNITQTLIAESEDIQFPFKPFDQDPLHKKFNNSFIGRFIAGGHENTTTNYYEATNINERNQLQYDLDSKEGTQSVAIDQNLVIHTAKSNLRSLFHIHAQIIDYQQVALMQEMTKIEPHNLVAFFTDGFFTNEKVNIATSAQPHKFKYTHEKIKGTSTYLPAVHMGIQCNAVPPIEHHVNRLSKFNITTGPAGCGKTYISFEKYPRINRISLAPNHKLKSALKKYNDNTTTYHKFFGIGVKYHEQQIYEQVDIDEITQCSDEHLAIIKNACLKNRMCLSLFGDLRVSQNDVIIYQRLPPTPCGGPITYPTICDFTCAQEISNIRRQSNEEAEFLDSLRGKSYPQILTLIKNKFPIKNDKDIKFTGESVIGISSNHERCNKFNNNFHEQLFQVRVKVPENNETKDKILVNARCIKKNKSHYKGESVLIQADKIWFGRTRSNQKTPTKYHYEPAYFCTADSIQGESIDIPIYIDLTKSSTENFLYSALTRCRQLSQITLISPLICPPV